MEVLDLDELASHESSMSIRMVEVKVLQAPGCFLAIHWL